MNYLQAQFVSYRRHLKPPQQDEFHVWTNPPSHLLPKLCISPLKWDFYISCVVNILLWGCENWSLHIEPMSRLKTFHTKCCRAIIGVTMWKVDDYSITNENILKHVGILLVEDIVHHRRLVWMGKIARMPLDRFPRKFLAAWMDCLPGNSYSRPHSRRQLSTRDSFLNSLEYIGIV